MRGTPRIYLISIQWFEETMHCRPSIGILFMSMTDERRRIVAIYANASSPDVIPANEIDRKTNKPTKSVSMHTSNRR